MDTKNKPQKIGEHGANLALCARVDTVKIGRNFMPVAQKQQPKKVLSFMEKLTYNRK